MRKHHILIEEGLPLPLSSLRLLVPPLRLVSAALWQVVQQRDVMDYGLVEEFVTTVLEIVPDMMSYRERVQLIMGLRAQLVLELCRSDHLANPETIQPHLNRMNTCIITHSDKEISDPEMEASELTFRKLIQTLLEDPVEKEHFFQNIFPEEFGPKYDSALQTLVWEFLSRLEKLLPAPTLQQTASWFLPDPSVLEECVQCVSHPQPLKTLLQHHNNTCGHVDTNALSSGDNQILASMSLTSLVIDEAFTDQADPEVQSEPEQECMSPVSSDNEPKMASLLEHMESELLPLNKEVKPAFLEVACRHKKTTAKNNTSFHHLHTDSGLKIQGKAHSSQHEVQDISTLSTSCRLRQPKVLLHRLDITDMKRPLTQVTATPRRERLQIDKAGSQGQRRGQVISQKSERNINEEPSDVQAQYSLAPDPSPPSGQPIRSKRVKICSLCGKTFSEAKDLTAHMRSHNEQSPYKCTQCGQDFEHHEDLQKHQQNVCEEAAQPEEDNMSTASFKEDDMSMTSVEDDWTEISHPHDTLPRNKRGPYVHHTPKAFQPSKARQICHVCHKTLCNVFMLRRHLKSVHGLRPYKCYNCEASFGNNPSLKKHVKECLKTKKRHPCSLCGVTFERSEGNQQEFIAAVKNGTVIPQTSSSTPQNATAFSALPVLIQSSSNYRTCLLCNETFDTAANLRIHLKCQHDVHPYPCINCGESFPSISDLRIHKCSGQNIPDSRKCPGCRNRTSQSTPEHLKISQEVNLRHQTDRPLVAAENEMAIPQSCNIVVDYSNDLQQCQPKECEINFQRGQQDWSEAVDPNQHPEEVDPNQHPEEVDPADRSSSLVPRENGTEIPQSQSTSSENPTTSKAPPTGVILNSRTCLVCYKTFFNRASLLQHRRRHSQGQGPHTCAICSRSFGRAFDLTRHQARKTGCGSMHRNLVVHENAPTEVKPVFSCPRCQEWFTSENKLETHMLCHTGEGFTCRFCGKMFVKQYKLYIHVRSHIDRPHLCDACGKDFRTKYALKVHTRVHTGERPFSCPDCGKRCSSKGNLKAHQQSHTGERPFACPLCKVRCRIKSQLKVHILTHTGERPHKCLACGKTFQLKLLLRKHQLASCS
ncbi:zinc finger protein Xfin-like isoform X2 [Salvelinus fontinalis]|uniref:zinc finger protein Xfin-like isoform X1 n=1 Tax=Salvelinus fontinalis TaxID=8038 RepID=UPI00248528BC|nr:zinc finger protein Xfin-like isoform X1 [Salvelinus fontinalis]XP_055738634.1 zinc finger protein Xfin-like isoform X2 [Salvelinus fontinalis]